jgi:F0F1-type ATP synthase assembly protein I
VDLRAKRELNSGFGNALSRAVEIAVTPIIFGFLGYLLDGWTGTRPLFMLTFGLLVFAYTMWKQVALYGRSMDTEQQRLFGARREETQP